MALFGAAVFLPLPALRLIVGPKLITASKDGLQIGRRWRKRTFRWDEFQSGEVSLNKFPPTIEGRSGAATIDEIEDAEVEVLLQWTEPHWRFPELTQTKLPEKVFCTTRTRFRWRTPHVVIDETGFTVMPDNSRYSWLEVRDALAIKQHAMQQGVQSLRLVTDDDEIGIDMRLMDGRRGWPKVPKYDATQLELLQFLIPPERTRIGYIYGDNARPQDVEAKLHEGIQRHAAYSGLAVVGISFICYIAYFALVPLRKGLPPEYFNTSRELLLILGLILGLFALAAMTAGIGVVVGLRRSRRNLRRLREQMQSQKD